MNVGLAFDLRADGLKAGLTEMHPSHSDLPIPVDGRPKPALLGARPQTPMQNSLGSPVAVYLMEARFHRYATYLPSGILSTAVGAQHVELGRRIVDGAAGRA